ncbi:MAG: tandem-95 repeat protein [Candidatus Scalindua sp. AMX11]|nr:MAG: tandem-95 repeat protein [Candidatus Scalindua sp.]NOG82594.1 tandem-95 repeat protein [Planctomycetota bacterium]RZV78330.1 MAG: tandem-95 repeat protein [Candidatus Scalindua sp. SCAELEC01]TDE65120.1 MAG: tandem-95 repeat protein [Candidatus Scalindua sp. AMX11]GJQ59530.1 MAG: hypothetical protein SCALA701_23310 [Candidatus Scalindua sp.]
MKVRDKIKISVCFLCMMVSVCVSCSLGVVQAGPGLKDSKLNTGNSAGSDRSDNPEISSDGNGYVYAVWEDKQNGSTDIYFNYSADYGVTWPTTDIRLDVGDVPGANRSQRPQISSDGNGHVYVTWYDNRNGKDDIYFNYSEDYGETWKTSDIRLDTGNAPGENYSSSPRISSDGNGHVYVTWHDSRNGKGDINFNYSEDYGETWQTSDIRLDVGDAPGANNSSSPRISSDGNGHVYVTWHDSRNGSVDIFFNHSEDYGMTWLTDDIRLDTGDSPGANSSLSPQITSDSNGHVYVVWEDHRNDISPYFSDADIYFNHSADYGGTWQSSDIRLDTGDAPGANGSVDPRISSDGNGHVYVTWQDRRNGKGDIYFNHSADYGGTWQSSDMRLDTGDSPGANHSHSPQMCSDESGHVYVTWEDWRNKYSGNDYGDIYFNYSEDNGVTWQSDDMRLNTGDLATLGPYIPPQISSDGNGHVYVTWVDKRNGNSSDSGIYFNSSNDYGVTWQVSDIKIDTNTPIFRLGSSDKPEISSDGNGHVYATWKETVSRNLDAGIYFNSSDDYGVTWQANDIRIDRGIDPGIPTHFTNLIPQISSDGSGHVYVTWEDRRNGFADIYLNYSADYGATWQTSAIRLDTGDAPGANGSLYPEISSDESGHVYVSWTDYRNGKGGIYFNYSADYGVTWQENDIRLDTGVALGARNPEISSDGNGHVYVTWSDSRAGNSDIFFNSSSDYGETWQASAIRLDAVGDAATTSDPEISSDGSGHVYVVWVDDRNARGARARNKEIYFNYSDDYGETWQENDIRIGTGRARRSSLEISSSGNGHVYVVWKDERNGVDDIYFNHSADYGVTWRESDIRLDTTKSHGSSRRPRISSDGNGRVYVTWYSLGKSHIYVDYSDDYGVTWQKRDIILDTGGAVPNIYTHDPEISSDKNGHAYVVWLERGNDGGTDVYFNYFFVDGIVNVTNPSPGSTLTTSTVAFKWDAGGDEDLYRLHIGSTGPGSSDILKRNNLAATSYTVTGIPIDGNPIYVRLRWRIGDTWNHFADYVYRTQGDGNQSPTAHDDTETTTVATPVRIRVISGDHDPDGTIDPATVVVVSGPTNGMAVANGDGTVTYTPLAGYSGQDTFRYTVNDALGATSNAATVTVTIRGDPPALISPTAGSTLTTTVVTFKWDTGTEEGRYRLHIGTKGPGSSDILKRNNLATTSYRVTGITLNGNPIYVRLRWRIGNTWNHFSDYVYQMLGGDNQAPTADDDTATTTVDTPVRIRVITGDHDPDGTIDPATVVVTSGPTNGTVVANGDGTVTYTPFAGYSGQDRFRYTVDDDLGLNSNEAMVTVSIGGDPPVITVPAPGSTFTEKSALFQWVAGTEEERYRLHIGTTGPGSSDILKRNNITTTTYAVTGIPTNGNPLYVRLRWRIGDTWNHFADYVYLTQGQACTDDYEPNNSRSYAYRPLTPGGSYNAKICSPTDIDWYKIEIGSEGDIELELKSPQTPCLDYNMYLFDSKNILVSYSENGDCAHDSILYSALPGTYFISISGADSSHHPNETYELSGTWPATSVPEITNPAPNTTLPCGDVTFHWSPNGTPVSRWSLYVGTTPGGYDIYSEGNIRTATSRTVSGIPEDGSTIFVKLWYDPGPGQFVEFRYTACQGDPTPSIISPTQGSQLECSTHTFTWTNPNGSINFRVYAGSRVGRSDYFDSGELGTATGSTVVGLPSNGSRVYVRLLYYLDEWRHKDYTFKACADGDGGCTGFDSQFNGSGNAPNWIRDFGTWNIVSGGYYFSEGVFTSTDFYDPSTISTYNSTYSDVDYRVKLRRHEEGGDSLSNRLLVHVSGEISDDEGEHPSNTYSFIYSKSGRFSVWKTVNDYNFSLQSSAPSSAIHTGDAWNVLRVVANGPNLRFYINGTLVWVGWDNDLSSGRVGMSFYRGNSTTDGLWVDWATLDCLTAEESATFWSEGVSAEQQMINDAANANPIGDINDLHDWDR